MILGPVLILYRTVLLLYRNSATIMRDATHVLGDRASVISTVPFSLISICTCSHRNEVAQLRFMPHR